MSIMKQLELKTEKLYGFKNRVYTVLKDFVFNGQTIKEGLKSDGGTVPKPYIFALLCYLIYFHNINWLLLVMYAMAIDESSGWFQKPYYLHDQSYKSSKGKWKVFFTSTFTLFMNMMHKVNNYRCDCTKWTAVYKHAYHRTLGYILAICYPLGVIIFGAPLFYIKYRKGVSG
jgi:hypothetical protein